MPPAPTVSVAPAALVTISVAPVVSTMPPVPVMVTLLLKLTWPVSSNVYGPVART